MIVPFLWLKENSELFVKGRNSAGGTAAQARDTTHQAIYRLRGKSLNSQAISAHKVLSNQEYSDIIGLIGCGFGKDFDITKVNFHKIVIMTDADPDGAHILVLLLTFFYQHMRPLVDAGYIYVALPPLYKIKEGRKEIFIKDNEAYDKFIDDKIIANFKIGYIEDKKRKSFNAKQIHQFLKDTQGYTTKINNVASRYAVHPELVELIATNSKSDKLIAKAVEKKFEELKCTKTKAGLFVDGMIGNSYQSILINDNFIKDLSEFKEGLFKNYFMTKNDGEPKRTSLTNLLNTIYNFATPKERQRFKGLGKLLPHMRAISYCKLL